MAYKPGWLANNWNRGFLIPYGSAPEKKKHELDHSTYQVILILLIFLSFFFSSFSLKILVWKKIIIISIFIYLSCFYSQENQNIVEFLIKIIIYEIYIIIYKK